MFGEKWAWLVLWKRVIIVPQAGADSLVFVRDGNDGNYTFTLHTGQ